MKRRRSFLHIISSLLFSAVLAVTVDLAAAFFVTPIPFVIFSAVLIVCLLLLILCNISTNWLWLFFFVILAAACILLTAIMWGYHRNTQNIEMVEQGSGSISIVDMKGNIVKEHFIDEKGIEQFQIRTRGFNTELTVSVNNPTCFAKYENEIITVKCPKEENCILTVCSLDGQHSAYAYVSNPGRFMRQTGPYFSALVQQFKEVNLLNSNTYKLLSAITE